VTPIMRWRLRQDAAHNGRWLGTSADRTTPVALTIVVLVAVAIMNGLGFGRTTVEAIIMLAAVVGLYSYSGMTGIASFGHVAYMAVGGYAATLLTLPAVVKSYRLPGLPSWLAGTEMDPYLALVVAFLCGTVVAGLFGLLVWRLSGLAAGIATLALLLVVFTIASGWENVTGGRGAVPGVPQISSLTPALIVALLAIWATWAFQRSRWGRFAQGTREDEAAARAIGIRVHLVRWLCMTFSGGLMALAGALYVYFVGSISPDFFYVPMMFNILAILVIGGMLSITGAVLGTVFVQFLRQVLEPLDSGFAVGSLQFDGRPGLRFVVLGMIMLLMLARRPGGIVNGYELRLPVPQRWRRSGRDTTGPDAGGRPADRAAAAAQP
jgi:branched-chain amino acid transport system permease protein